MINVTDVFVSTPIRNAILKINPNADVTVFQPYPEEEIKNQGFQLGRIADNLKEEGKPHEPIEVTRYRDTDKYLIINGRHRFAFAVARGDRQIEAKVLRGGKRKTRKRRMSRRRTRSSRR